MQCVILVINCSQIHYRELSDTAMYNELNSSKLILTVLTNTQSMLCTDTSKQTYTLRVMYKPSLTKHLTKSTEAQTLFQPFFKAREGVSERWGAPNTRLITCRFSKEHRHLNGVGECEGSKYVCTHSHIVRCSFEGRPLSTECSETPVH